MNETVINIESVRIPEVRADFGSLAALGGSIGTAGLRHPITVWTDGTLISGSRRLRAYYLMAGAPGGSKFRHIPAMFVNTIEDAAKRLLADNQDTYLAQPMKRSEICRLWEVLRALDAPAAAQRRQAAVERGVELRRATLVGERQPGRAGYTIDYVLHVLADPFGISEATARRLWAIYAMGWVDKDVTPAEQTRARRALDAIDAGESSIWANYQHLKAGRSTPTSRPKVIAAVEPAPAARQLAAWEKSLPQMEGLVAGLAELGWPHPNLTWEQVMPVRARLAAVRRRLDRMIKNMKENDA